MIMSDLRDFLSGKDTTRDIFTVYDHDLEAMDSADRLAVIEMLRDAASKGEVSVDSSTTDIKVRRIAKTKTVFAGEADARQQDDATPSVFRPRYRKLSEAELSLHDEIKTAAQNLWDLFEKVENPGRYVAMAKTHLETSVMFAVKDLTK